MSNRTSLYKFLYSQFGDIWYPGYDYENMLTVESQFSGLYSFIKPGVLSGWDVTKLVDSRADQILLLDAYNANVNSEYGVKLQDLNLEFDVTAKLATTLNITLSGEQTIDGVSAVTGDIVLVKNQSTSANNGVYVVSSSTWTRHSSLNSSSDYSENFVCYVSSGLTNEKTLWIGAVSSQSFILGTNNLNFDNAFKQCIKVSTGRGIVSKFSAKTEKVYYFRYTNTNTYFVWAESGLSTLKDEYCNIVSPQVPNEKYDSYNEATYLASVIVDSDSTYNSYKIVSDIIYSEKRNQISSDQGEFQKNLQLSFLSHKHLGSSNPDQINLQNYVYLKAYNFDNFENNFGSSIFVLRSLDGALFIDTLSNYGSPIVSLDGVELTDSEYAFDQTSGYLRLFLKTSVKTSSSLFVILPKAKTVRLIAIDATFQKLTSAITLQSFVLLSDGNITQKLNDDGSTSDIYSRFAWTNYKYKTAKVYLDGNLLSSQHYEINPNSGTIYLNKTLPNYDDYTFEDLVVYIDENIDEVTGLLSNKNIDNFDANQIISGKVSLDNLKIYHSSRNRYKETLNFTPDKYLTSGIGRTILYPFNTSSSLQFSDSISNIYESNNINSNIRYIYAASSRGLHLLNKSNNLAIYDSDWNNDFGKIKDILDDNVLGSNYFKKTYFLTYDGQIYSKKSSTIEKIKLPTNSAGLAFTASSFCVSTDKLQLGSGSATTYAYRNFIHFGTLNGLFYAIIEDGQKENEWEWTKVSSVKNSSNEIENFFEKVSDAKEITTLNTEFVEGDIDLLSSDRKIYVASTGNTSKGLYSGNYSGITKVFDQEVKGIYVVQDGTTNLNKNSLIWWTDYAAYVSHSAYYTEDANGKRWTLPLSSTASTSNILAATSKKLFASYSSVSSPHTLTYYPYEVNGSGSVSVASSTTVINGNLTKFNDYAGIALSIGIGATSVATVSQWYGISSIEENNKINLSQTYSGSSIANTSYVLSLSKSIFGVDDYTYSSTGSSQTVLVKNQTDKTQNGVYYVSVLGSSSLNWELTRVTNIGTTANSKLSIINGTKNQQSIWYFDPFVNTVSFGSTEFNYYPYILKIYQNSTPVGSASSSIINCVTQRRYKTSVGNEYLIGHSNGIARVVDVQQSGDNTTYEELYWESGNQGSVQSIYSFDDESNYGKTIAATNYGLFIATDLLWNISNSSSASSVTNYKWVRSNNLFSNNDVDFTVFNKDYESITQFTINDQYQTVNIGTSYVPGQQLFFENSFTKFTTNPWYPVNNIPNNEKTRVMAYVNDLPTQIPFYTNSSGGTVTFTKSVGKDNFKNVKLTIAKDNANNDYGIKPHSAIFQPLAKSFNPISVLVNTVNGGDTLLNVSSLISTDTKFLLLKNQTNNAEIVYIKSIDNTVYPIRVTLHYELKSSFSAGSLIYKVSDDVLSNLEDDLYYAHAQTRYYQSSNEAANILNLSNKLKSGISTVFDWASPVISQTDTRGLKETLRVQNFIADSVFDSTNSDYKNRTQLVPSSLDIETNPFLIKSSSDINKTGTNSRIATNKGVWKHDSGYWTLENRLDHGYDVNYLKYNASLELLAGTSNGLWKLVNNLWVKQKSFEYKQNDFLTGFLDGELFEAYASSNGLSVHLTTSQKIFKSDYLKISQGKSINGLFLDSYNKIINGIVSAKSVLHACGDDGYFTLVNTGQNSTFSSFLQSRKMFASGNPEGVTSFYKSFTPFSIPSVPSKPTYANSLFILTNDGILKVKNFKYCYPEDVNSSDFIVEERYLRGKNCYSYAIDTESGIGLTPGKSKIYIGTDNGVYRSVNEGNNFYKTQNIGSNPVCVYDLKIIESTFNSTTQNVLLAFTDNGIWYTIDDGDNWYRTGTDTDDSLSPITFSSIATLDERFIPTDSGTTGYLAQSFTTSSTASTIDKVSAYITIRPQDTLSLSSYNSAISNNTLTAYVYSLDVNGLPDTQLAASSTIAASGINTSGFTSFLLSSSLDIPGTGASSLALVIKEVTSAVPIFRWKKSSLANPYTLGKALYSANDITWSGINTSFDLFFKVHYDNNYSPIETISVVGNYDNTETNWDLGDYSGLIINDDGYLKLDSKFVSPVVFDDSKSMSKLLADNDYKIKFNSLIDTLTSRTRKTVTSYTDPGNTYSNDFNLYDLWSFGTSVKHLSSTGFTGSGTAITNYVSNLRLEGTKSELYNTINYASIGLEKQSIKDLCETGTSSVNESRLTIIRDYLAENNLLRLSEIKDKYKNLSGLQATLFPKTGSSVGTTLTFSIDDSNTFTWTTALYPYAEVVKNDTVLSSGYTLLPSSGQVSFSTPIVSTDEIVLNLREDWDGTADTIPANSSASQYMLDKWAKSFIPVMFVVSDGDNTLSNTTEVINNIKYSWNGSGSKFVYFNPDKSGEKDNLRLVDQNLDSLYFDANSNNAWDNSKTSLLHGGENNIFSAKWTRNIEFSSAKYLRSITTEYISSTGQSVDSSVLVEFRYSTDKNSYTNWASFSTTYSLNKEVTNLDFRITLKEGWNYHNSSRVIPYVKKLYYTEVTPAINYLYSDPIANPNNILEYILGTDYDDFDKAKLTWGICQGNSTNWNDYEEILSFKNGILANRQKSFKFTNPVVFDSLVAVKSLENDYNYVVFNNGQKFTWNIIDAVQVTVNNTTLPSTSYRADNVNGNIVFVNPVSSGNTVEVKITKPKERYQSYGEGTVTSDYVNYYLVNGRWPNDSNIVVLVDNVIQRNNFKTDRESGSIIFDKKQSLDSKVTVSIFGSDYYRIGLKVEDYDSTSSKIYNFGLTKNTVPNSDIIFKLNQTPIPSVKSNSFVVDSDQKFVSIGSSNQLSLASRMYLDYVYESDVNSKEYYPRTKWYRTRTSGLLTTTIELDSAPNYRNRIVQKKSDLLENNNYFIENDVIYATIEPFDSIDYGIVYTTDNIILKDIQAPFVYDVQIKSLSDVINNTISSLSELQAYYIFNNSNFGTDQSLVEWFEWTNGKTSKILEGSVLNSSYVTSGKAFSFKVTPYNGQIYGIPIESSIINII